MKLINEYIQILREKNKIKKVLNNSLQKREELRSVFLEKNSTNSLVSVDGITMSDPDGNVINYIYEYREKKFKGYYSVYDCIYKCKKEIEETNKELEDLKRSIQNSKEIEYKLFSLVVFDKKTPTVAINKLKYNISSSATLWRVHNKLKKIYGSYDKLE